MEYYPDPTFMYQMSLEKSAIISLLLSYKVINAERLKNIMLCFKSEYNEAVPEIILESIKKNPKISYIEIMNLGEEKDEFEMYLEKMIEDRIIFRRGENSDSYWKIKK